MPKRFLKASGAISWSMFWAIYFLHLKFRIMSRWYCINLKALLKSETIAGLNMFLLDILSIVAFSPEFLILIIDIGISEPLNISFRSNERSWFMIASVWYKLVTEKTMKIYHIALDSQKYICTLELEPVDWTHNKQACMVSPKSNFLVVFCWYSLVDIQMLIIIIALLLSWCISNFCKAQKRCHNWGEILLIVLLVITFFICTILFSFHAFLTVWKSIVWTLTQLNHMLYFG